MREKPYLFAMNGGEVSPLAMARVDLARMKISAETALNVTPRVVGPMQARAGLGYLGSTDGDAASRNIPFIFSATDTSLVELSDLKFRVRNSDTLISRDAVSTVVTNGDFAASTGWTLTVSTGGQANISNDVLTLATPYRGSTTLAKRSDTVSGGDDGVEHAIEITVDVGPVKFRCGSTDGGDEYIAETELKEGFHSLAFTPTAGSYYIQFSCESEASRVVSNVAIASSGTMEIVAPWTAAQLFSLRYDQSGDVIFITSSDKTMQPHRIERRAATSWSLTPYYFTDGPFREKTADISLTPSALTGNGTLTASAAFFKAGHVGTVFRISHQKTRCSSVLSGADQFTDTVRVSGNTKYDIDSDGANEDTNERDVLQAFTGTWVGTVSMQLSADKDGPWRKMEGYTGAGSGTKTPGTENSVVYVRTGFIGDDYTSGEVTVDLTYEGGGGDGYVVITAVTNSTSATYEVMSRLHGTDASKEWVEGTFSPLRGWPSAIALFEGRLWWGGDDKVFGSVSDGFESFDLEVEGDSGPIIRSVATGAVNNIRWILGLARLCIGTSGAEPVGRSSSFDEPVTPTNFSIKDASTQGCADVEAVKIDKSGIFVQRSGKRAYSMSYSLDNQDYASGEVTKFHPTILGEGVKVMAVQRQPDTRVWFVLDDGTAAILIWEPVEDVITWYRLTTDGLIEDVAVLPNTSDDDVYLIVNRTINSVEKRYVEKLAYDDNAHGGTTNRMGDSYIVVSVAASDQVTGLGHLEGEDVVVWDATLGTAYMTGDAPTVFTVASGAITLPASVTGDMVVGLEYTWQWKSAKLAYGVADGNPVNRRKKVTHLAPVLHDTHIRGLQFSNLSFSDMNYLPLTDNITGVANDTSKVYAEYDPDMLSVKGGWNTDSRVYLQGVAPLPCTVKALSLMVDAN